MGSPPKAVWVVCRPNAATDAVVGRRGEAWLVDVVAPPDAGRANRALVRLLAAAWGLPEDHLAIAAGRTARRKLVRRVDGQPLPRAALPAADSVAGVGPFCGEGSERPGAGTDRRGPRP